MRPNQERIPDSCQVFAGRPDRVCSLKTQKFNLHLAKLGLLFVKHHASTRAEGEELADQVEVLFKGVAVEAGVIHALLAVGYLGCVGISSG